MIRNKYYILDVFAEKKYAGNQLAVFLDAGNISDTEMQDIARETNFSETTFILSDTERDGGYDVRIFTPGKEVDFAGHPTLGTAFAIQEYILRKPVEKVVLNLKVGQIPVTFSGREKNKTLWMEQINPVFGKEHSIEFSAGLLSIDESRIDTRFPVQEVSTGLPHIIVPLKSLAALKQIRICSESYRKLIKERGDLVVLAFSPESYNKETDISVRVFPVCYNISEDPATGSGNGCLAGYLSKHKYFGSSQINVRSGQGFEINRPSILYLKAEEEGETIKILVGGRVAEIAEGNLM